MDGNCYSPLKIFHHRDRIDAMRKGERPDLLHLQLIPTNRCNQNCTFCAYRTKGYSSSEDFNPLDEIPFTKLVEIIQDAKELGVKAVEITGGGEPLLHKNFPELCSCLRENQIDYGVVTNGSLLDDRSLHALHEAKWVRFSLDAGKPHTYAETRHSRPDVLPQMRDRIRELRSMRNGLDPVIGIGFVIHAGNWHEVLLAAMNAKEDGADNFRISAVFQDGGADYFLPFYKSVIDLCRAAEDLSDEHFRVFNLFGERLEDLEQQSPSDSFCGFQNLCTYVGADQNVYRCCVLAYNQQGFLGTLKHQSFKDLWLSDYVTAKLRNFNARKCPRCMYNRKNQTIAYSINPNPPHVNFL